MQVAARGGDDSPDEQRSISRRLMTYQESLGLSDAEEQIVGKPWNYQQRFDPKLFYKSTQFAPNLYALPEGVCDL